MCLFCVVCLVCILEPRSVCHDLIVKSLGVSKTKLVTFQSHEAFLDSFTTIYRWACTLGIGETLAVDGWQLTERDFYIEVIQCHPRDSAACHNLGWTMTSTDVVHLHRLFSGNVDSCVSVLVLHGAESESDSDRPLFGVASLASDSDLTLLYNAHLNWRVRAFETIPVVSCLCLLTTMVVAGWP